MFFLRALQIILALLFLAAITFAQTKTGPTGQLSNEKLFELKKVWLENLTSDTTNLKLPENRAIVYARLGNLYWKIDKNRARLLFRTSIDELIKAQKEVEINRNSPNRNDLLIYGETRRKILEIIVGNDDDLGFELFVKSRSETVKVRWQVFL